MKPFDVVIVGAGIIGLSIAWQLARRSRLKVLVLEKGAAVGEGSTGASSAVCRVRYSLDPMVQLAHDGINAYRNWQEFTGLATPRARFQEDGVLWIPGADSAWSDREHLRMQGFGIPTEVLDDDEMRYRFPAFSTCTRVPDIETGAAHECTGGGRNLLEIHGGCFDPVCAAQDLVEACRGSGVEIRFRTRVAAVATRHDRVQSVTLQSGDVVPAPLLINAAGPWCQHLFEAAGLKLPWNLQAVRIQVLYRDLPAAIKGPVPVTASMADGIYFRTQNRRQQLVVGSVREEDETEVVDDPDNFQTVADQDFELKTMHLLHHRIPALPYRGAIRSYCGLYTINRDDVHPLVGPTAIDGLWAANGFSGHGFKLAPAIGSLVAQAITGCPATFDTQVPMAFFALDRQPIKVDSKSVLA